MDNANAGVAQFDIGFVPKGWTRGEPLNIANGGFASGQWAAVSQAMALDYDAPIAPDAFYIRFHEDDKRKVAKWIEWWNAAQCDAP
jgi:hypothetical protein